MSSTPHVTSRPGDPTSLLKVEAVAQRLNVSPRTVRRYAARKLIASTTLPGGGLRFERDEVERVAGRQAS